MGNIQKCYWNSKGKYQNIHDKMYKEMVPKQGPSDTVQGELIRGISRLYYEYCNNGNCNAKNETWEWVGSGTYEQEWDEDAEEYVDGDEEGEDEITDIQVSAYYAKFLELINQFVPNSSKQVEAVGEVICQYNRCTFEGTELQAYIDITDLVTSWVARNKNAELTFPDWYDKN